MIKDFERRLFLLPDDGTNVPNTEDESNENIDEENENIENDDSYVDENEEEEEENEEEEEDTVPLATFLEMKKQLKELKKKVNSSEIKELNESLKAKKEKYKQKWIDKGYDEEFAEGLADDFIELHKQNIDSKVNDKLEKNIDDELDDISNSDDFFSNIKDYKKEIVKYVKDQNKKGNDVSLEDAYIKVVGLQNRLKELRTNESLKNQYKNKKSSKAVGTASNTSKKKSSYNLDATDLEALKGLQKMQPDSNWTKEKYFKMIKKK